MKIAIISDIHSNFEALKEVMNKISDLNIDKIICLGDVIGYGPSPNKCLELILQNTDTILMGNHEFALLHPEYLQFFSSNAKAGINYTKQVLLKHYFLKINEFGLTKSIDNLMFSHSCISQPTSFKYITSIFHAMDEFKFFGDNQILFIGHTHYPIIFEENSGKYSEIKADDELEIEFRDGLKYIVNVGSVGQPRNGDSRSTFFVYETQKKIGRYYKVFYNIDVVYEKIKNIPELPIFLGKRLYKGV